MMALVVPPLGVTAAPTPNDAASTTADPTLQSKPSRFMHAVGGHIGASASHIKELFKHPGESASSLGAVLKHPKEATRTLSAECRRDRLKCAGEVTAFVGMTAITLSLGSVAAGTCRKG
jgi:hypothetical protein